MADKKGISLGQGLSILANLGVIVGLVFVVLELQQTRTSLAAEVELGLLNAQLQTLQAMVDDHSMADIVRRSYVLGPDSLDPTDFTRLTAHIASGQNVAFAAYQLWKAGAISDETWDRHAGFHALVMSADMQRFWLDNSQGVFPAEFVEEIQSRFPEPIDFTAIEQLQADPPR